MLSLEEQVATVEIQALEAIITLIITIDSFIELVIDYPRFLKEE